MKIMSKEWRKLSRAEKNKYFKRWKCDYCGLCDTGTDADFDRYAVQVQNGEGYYDASGAFHFYENWRDD